MSQNENLVIVTHAGEHFSTVADRAKEYFLRLFNAKKTPVQFDFNGITCVVTDKTNVKHLYRDYGNAWALGHKIVGPNCEPEISDADAEKIRLYQEESSRKQAESLRKSRERDAQLLAEAEAFVAGIEFDWKEGDHAEVAEFMDASPQDQWVNHVRKTGILWGRILQKHVANGEEITKKLIDDTVPHYMDLSGSMVWACLQFLANEWKQGNIILELYEKK